jgi:hypothetical protein
LETNAQNYTWADGSNLPYLEIKNGGDYSVVVSNNAGCKTQGTIKVNESTATPASVEQLYDCKGYMRLTAQNGYNDYTWSFGANTANAEVNNSGQYELVVTNTYGCTAMTVVNVKILLPPLRQTQA